MPDSNSTQNTVPAGTTASTYEEAAHWISSNPGATDAQDLAKLMLFLSTTDWSYGVAFECTQQMNESALARALRVLQQYFQTGRCQELQRVADELQRLLPHWSDAADVHAA
jgi:hypothetical protein